MARAIHRRTVVGLAMSVALIPPADSSTITARVVARHCRCSAVTRSGPLLVGDVDVHVWAHTGEDLVAVGARVW
jgi:hypothetical protein